MTLNTRDRSVLFESLSKLADPEAVDAMLAHFPAREVDEPLTRDYLDSRLIEFREDIRLTLVTEFRSFDTKITSLRQDMTTEIGSMRQDMASEIGSLDAKIGSLRQDLDDRLLRSLQWTVGTMIALAAVIVAVVALT